MRGNPEQTNTVIVGAGQAGLAMSAHLTKNNMSHIILEKHRLVERWRTARWDSLVANGPAWHDRFPVQKFAGISGDDFATREASLLRIERDLQSKRTILSEEAYRAEVAQFQNEVASIQKEIQFKRQALDKAFQEAQDEIRNLAAEIVAEIAGSQKLDVVINKSAALVFRQDLDITEEVITQLNERTKNARLEIQEE